MLAHRTSREIKHAFFQGRIYRGGGAGGRPPPPFQHVPPSFLDFNAHEILLLSNYLFLQCCR